MDNHPAGERIIMKPYLLTLLTCVAITLFLGCAGLPIADPIASDESQNKKSRQFVYYALPQTVVEISVPVSRTIKIAPVFAHYQGFEGTLYSHFKQKAEFTGTHFDVWSGQPFKKGVFNKSARA